jgi:hypothetical protein
MTLWQDVLDSVQRAFLEFGRPDGSELFFRGQLSQAWSLTPSLARLSEDVLLSDSVVDRRGERLSMRQRLENSFYYQLHARGGHLLPRNPRPWEILFLMRHHGFPTRLLDWSRSFGIALFFALARTPAQDAELGSESPAVWILDPGKLNIQTRGDTSEVVCYLDTDYPIGYEQYFAHHLGEHYGTFPHPVVAAWADSSNERLRAQKGAFTLHRDLDMSIEGAFPSCVRKIVIPRELFPAAVGFLNLAGIDHTSLFPDMDALAAFLVNSMVR